MNRKKIICTGVSVAAIIILTVCIFFFRKNYLYVNRDRLCILTYQTDITGSNGESWAEKLKEKFSFLTDVEVSTYFLKEVGNENITIRDEDGWGQIVTRLAAKQGDILLVNNKTFYETLLANDFIIPLECNFGNRNVLDKNGNTVGVDLTGIKFNSLINLETSKYVAIGQPLPLYSLDEKDYDGFSPRVIAVIYKGSKHIEESQKTLELLIKEDIYE